MPAQGKAYSLDMGGMDRENSGGLRIDQIAVLDRNRIR
jgi:hypothetical protein